MKFLSVTMCLQSLLLILAAQHYVGAPLPTPVLTRVQPEADTVWLLGPPPTERWRPATDSDSALLAYAWPRTEGRWVRTGRVPAERVRRRIPVRAGEAVRVTEDLELVKLSEGQAGYGRAFDEYALRSRATGRVDTLRLRAPPERRREIFERVGIELRRPSGVDPYPLATGVGAWVVSQDAVWIGLEGGISAEGAGGVGGLLRFDLSRRALELVDVERLGLVTVTGMAAVRGELWISTLFRGEGGTHGTGLFRYDPATDRWRRYTKEEAPLPDDAIRDVAADGARVWVSTRGGPVMLDTRTGAWRSWHLSPALAGDSLVFEIESGPAPADSVRLAAFELMHRLGTGRRRAFLEAAGRVPASRLRDYTRSVAPGAASEALSHPALLPFLLDALERGRSTRSVAEALTKLSRSDPDSRAMLRARLEAAEPVERVELALALARVGSDLGYEVVRGVLREAAPKEGGDGESPDREATERAIEAAADLSDRTSVPLLAALLDRPRLREAGLDALLRIATPEVWEPVGEVVLGTPRRWAAFLETANGRVYWRSRRRDEVVWEDPVFRRLACEVAARTIADPARAVPPPTPRLLTPRRPAGEPADSAAGRPRAVAVAVVIGDGRGSEALDVKGEAAVLLHRLGDPRGAEALIGLLTATRESYRFAAGALAEALPAEDPPEAGREFDEAERTAAQDYWRRWWEAHRDATAWRPCEQRG